jgi:hypothetical protein
MLIIVVVEFVTSGFRAAQGGGNLLDVLIIVSGACYIAVCLAASLYFVIIGAQVLRSLKKGTKIIGTKSHRQRLLIRKTTALVIATAVLIWVLILSMIVAVVQDVFWDPYGFHIDLMVQDFAILIISILQISTFKARKVTNVSIRPSKNESIPIASPKISSD